MDRDEIGLVNSCLMETFDKSHHGNIFEGTLSDDDPNNASGCILMYQDRMLLQKRSLDSDEGGSYACFGGSAKFGEDPEQTMYREIEEECGLGRDDLYDVLPFTEFKSGNFTFKTYIARIKDESLHSVMTDHESQGWVFKTFSETLKMNLHPNFRMTLEESHQSFMDYMHEFDYVKTVKDVMGEEKITRKKTFFESVKTPFSINKFSK